MAVYGLTDDYMSAPICPVHSVEAKWKEGVSKTTNKPYAFWSCGKKNADGSWCSHKFDQPKTNTAKFEQSLDAADSMNAQSKKDALITRTALAKSFIEAGKTYNVETVKEYHRWLALVEGRAVKVEGPNDEIRTEDIPF